MGRIWRWNSSVTYAYASATSFTIAGVNVTGFIIPEEELN